MSGDIEKKSKKPIIIGAVLVIAIVAGAAYYYTTHISLKKETVITELGAEMSTDVKQYAKTTEYTKKDAKVDLSDVDFTKTGTYEGKVIYKDRELKFQVKVEDTAPPDVKLKQDLQVIVGQELGSDQIIESMEDYAGIQSIAFDDAMVGEASQVTEDGTVVPAKLKYEEIGEKENTIIIADKNGNKSKEVFTIKVVENYAAHVKGIADQTVEAGSKIDFMSGITYDEKVSSVTVDTGEVDMNTPGDYVITYKIVGDDEETTVTKQAKVTVLTPEAAQEAADSGRAVKTTGENKPKSSIGGSSSSSSGSTSKRKSNSSSSKKSVERNKKGNNAKKNSGKDKTQMDSTYEKENDDGGTTIGGDCSDFFN